MSILTQSIDNFSGGDEQKTRQFIDAVENAAAVGEWTDLQTLSIARIKLRDEAAAFVRLKKDTINTWADLAAQLEKRFAVREPVLSSLQKFLNCVQHPNETVQQYAQRFEMLLARALPESSDPAKDKTAKEVFLPTQISQFIRGLRSDIRRAVFTKQPTTYAQAMQYAVHEEGSLMLFDRPNVPVVGRLEYAGRPPGNASGPQRENRSYDNRPNSNRYQNNSDYANRVTNMPPRGGYAAPAQQQRPRAAQPSRGAAPPADLACYNCGGQHFVRMCPAEHSQCRRCGGWRHLAEFCRANLSQSGGNRYDSGYNSSGRRGGRRDRGPPQAGRGQGRTEWSRSGPPAEEPHAAPQGQGGRPGWSPNDQRAAPVQAVQADYYPNDDGAPNSRN